MVLAIAGSATAIVFSISASSRAQSAEKRAEDMRDFANARFEDLSNRFAILEREARVSQERISDMKVEMIRRGIPVTDH